ncbi:hypothetical protein ACJMK2_007646 [Sinanodonta woodiana]|uniref:TNFR-Cys domain-containing protein n=1 Tax=Sinanodonta woodiana TaxID=1069815 RepID=A0ABD3VJ52_SINWO
MLQMIVSILIMAKTIGHPDCPMYTANRTSCFLCPPGYYKIRDCDENGTAASCMPCPAGTFQTSCSQATMCQPCDSYCPWFNSYIQANCTTTANLVCQCKPGYFFIDQGGGNGICKKHEQCPPGSGMSRPGTSMVDVLCSPCVSGKTYSNVSSSTQECQICSTCVSNVISPCTPYRNINCSAAIMTLTDYQSQPASSVIIAM